MSNKLLSAIIFGTVLGVLFRSFFNFGLSFVLFVILLALVVFLIKPKNSLLFVVILLSFSFGVVRFEISETRDFSFEEFLEQEISIEGIIGDEPSKRENNTHLVVTIFDTKEKILMFVDRGSIFKYGDTISAKGVLKKPQNFITDNNKEFDYVNYLSKDKIYYQMYFPEVELVESGGGNFIKRNLFSLKSLLVSKINRVIPSPESEYLGGLLFGVKESLGDDLEEDFRKTGLIHVVVLSGYNVTIVADSIMKSLSVFPRVVGMSLGGLAIVFFAIMTGASATTVRASIMALLVILSRITGRRYNIIRALFIAGFFMVLHNPKILVFDISFQLSFLATLGLIYLSPIVYKKLGFLPTKYQLRELASATIATQIFVLPVLLYKIGEMSLIAPISNLFILPFIPLTMLFGFITSILGLLWGALSLPFAFLSYGLLLYQLKAVEFFSEIPYVSVGIESFPFWLLVLVYVFYFFIYRKLL